MIILLTGVSLTLTNSIVVTALQPVFLSDPSCDKYLIKQSSVNISSSTTIIVEKYFCFGIKQTLEMLCCCIIVVLVQCQYLHRGTKVYYDTNNLLRASSR